MTEITDLTKGWTPGGVGIWVLVASFLGIWWKGLPAVLDAWTNSVHREREHREREIERLEKQIVASDARHEECMEGQARLREEIDRLRNQITGYLVQMRQMQLSGVMTPLTPDFSGMIAALAERPERKQ